MGDTVDTQKKEQTLKYLKPRFWVYFGYIVECVGNEN